MAILSMIFVNFTVGMCAIHTGVLFLRFAIFAREEKWSPLSVMRLTHYALDNAIKKLKKYDF